MNAADIAPPATVTDAGTVSAELLLASAMMAPPVGEACESVTVQAADAAETTELGLHCRLVTVMAG